MKLSFLLISVMSIAMAQEKATTWLKEPDGFKGVKFDFSQEQTREITGLRCDSYVSYKKEQTCSASPIDVEGPRGFRIKLRFTFVDDKMRSVVGSFASDNYQDIREMFVDKYGSPTSSENSVVQTVAGGQYQKEILFWMGARVNLLLENLGSDITEGLFAFSLVEDDLAKEKEHEAAKKKALQ